MKANGKPSTLKVLPSVFMHIGLPIVLLIYSLPFVLLVLFWRHVVRPLLQALRLKKPEPRELYRGSDFYPDEERNQ